MSSLTRWKKRTANFLSVAVSVATIVGLWSFLEYFNSSAKVDFQLSYHNINYDTEAIVSDFHMYGVQIPGSTQLPYGTSINPTYPHDEFKKRKNVELYNKVARIRRDLNLDKDLRDAIVFKLRERAGNRRERPVAAINNRAFWESEFPHSIDSVVDSVTFQQAMRIVISHRGVTMLMGVSNLGTIAARDVKLTLQSPWLLKPRSLMTEAEVKFLQIQSDRAVCQISNNGNYANISIPFLEVGATIVFTIVTSMTNLTADNVYLHYETARGLDAGAIVWTTVIGVIAVYLAPFALSPFSRLLLRMRRALRKRKSNPGGKAG